MCNKFKIYGKHRETWFYKVLTNSLWHTLFLFVFFLFFKGQCWNTEQQTRICKTTKYLYQILIHICSLWFFVIICRIFLNLSFSFHFKITQFMKVTWENVKNFGQQSSHVWTFVNYLWHSLMASQTKAMQAQNLASFETRVHKSVHKHIDNMFMYYKHNNIKERKTK